MVRSSFILAATMTVGSVTALHAEPPVVEPQSTLVASDATVSDIFGGAVGLTDSTLVVGARGLDVAGSNAGGAYVYGLTGGVWSQVQKVTAAGATAGDEYGGAVAIDGVRFALGAAQATTVAGPGAGRVAVFTFNGVSWVESAAIVAPAGGQADAGFGSCVALSGTVLVTGAPRHDTGVRDEGVVYVHRFDTRKSIWMLEAVLEAPDAGENDRFGTSVAIDGDRIVVGVARDDDAGIDAGAAWVFEWIDGVWVGVAKLTGSEGDWQSGFGVAVAIDGQAIAVGADRDDTFGLDDGAVHVFEWIDGVWSRSGVFGASGGGIGRELGVSVALDGNRLIAGMPVDDDGGSDVGAAVSWRRIAGVWTEESIVRPVAAADLSLIGASVAAQGDRLVVGAPLWGGVSEPIGAALVLDLTADCDADGQADVVAIAAGDVEDCNGNEIPDGCDIEAGTEQDVDGNGIPDSCFFDCDGNGLDDATEIKGNPGLDVNGNAVLDACECLADLFVDGQVNGADLGVFLAYFGGCGAGTGNPSCIGDLNGDGLVNGSDLGLILASWGPCN